MHVERWKASDGKCHELPNDIDKEDLSRTWNTKINSSKDISSEQAAALHAPTTA